MLAHVLSLLNARHDYGLELFLLSIDEGISGYRDDSLDCVRRNRDRYGLPLKVVSYKELYGWSMDEIVAAIGRRNNCTFCGVFRRQALDRGAALVGAHKMVTGHNADDIAETVLMNLLRGDIARLGRCVSIVTGGDPDGPAGTGAPVQATPVLPAAGGVIAADRGVAAPLVGDAVTADGDAIVQQFATSNVVAAAASAGSGIGRPLSDAADTDTSTAAAPPSAALPPPPISSLLLPRCKPFKYMFEKEIVLYAHHQRLDYHATECIYSPGAYRGWAREYIKDVERVRPSAILDILESAESWVVNEEGAVDTTTSATAPPAAPLLRGSGGADATVASPTSDGSISVTAATETTDTTHYFASAPSKPTRRPHLAYDTDSHSTASSVSTSSATVRHVRGGSSGRNVLRKLTTRVRVMGTCDRCGYITSREAPPHAAAASAPSAVSSAFLSGTDTGCGDDGAEPFDSLRAVNARGSTTNAPVSELSGCGSGECGSGGDGSGAVAKASETGCCSSSSSSGNRSRGGCGSAGGGRIDSDTLRIGESETGAGTAAAAGVAVALLSSQNSHSAAKASTPQQHKQQQQQQLCQACVMLIGLESGNALDALRGARR